MNRTYVVRYAYPDQYPPGTDLRDAAWDSLLRYARHFELTFDRREVWTMSGYRWRSHAPGEPFYMTDVPGVRVDVHMQEKP
ncbi:hypothetical protein [Amycolatopsis sp. cmx-4-61]|uniref:hypothetical protein n=1 Tax=Amycolatopsis sp. cmx-4-61 TaxID=2790937 RepID=UPI00397CFA4A